MRTLHILARAVPYLLVAAVVLPVAVALRRICDALGACESWGARVVFTFAAIVIGFFVVAFGLLVLFSVMVVLQHQTYRLRAWFAGPGQMPTREGVAVRVGRFGKHLKLYGGLDREKATARNARRVPTWLVEVAIEKGDEANGRRDAD